jgi:aspartyl protease family protein
MKIEAIVSDHKFVCGEFHVMRLPNVVPSVILAVLFLGAGGFHKAPLETQYIYAATALKSGQNGHYFVTAEINGRSTKVLVDTGASAVALSYEDAQNIGLHPNNLDFNIPVSTANGVAKAASVTLDKIEIDGVRVSDVQGMVMPEGAMNGSLLGMSFLSKLSSFRVEEGVLYLKN